VASFSTIPRLLDTFTSEVKKNFSLFIEFNSFREFMDWLAEDMDIVFHEQWYNISSAHIIERGAYYSPHHSFLTHI
jgi:hypothetical protein